MEYKGKPVQNKRRVTIDVAGSKDDVVVDGKGRRRKQPDPLLWAQLKMDYESGMPIKGKGGLAEKYKRTPEVLRSLIKREGWVRKPEEPPTVTSIAIPEEVELDLNEQVILSDIGACDILLEGYASNLIVWRDMCEKVKRGEFIEQEVFDPESGQTFIKQVPVEISPFLFGHKDMKDFVASLINIQKHRKSLVDMLPMAKGVVDIEGQISKMAEAIQQGGIAGFQRSELPDVCYTEKKALTEKGAVPVEGEPDPEKAIEDELKNDGIFII
jgi:hypothetical protein